MCGHGAIGVAATLAHLGRLTPGQCRLETNCGVVTVTLHDESTATIENVQSYRHAKSIPVNVPGVGTITGDVAWGGNWFFLVENHGQHLSPANVDHLADFTWRIRQSLVSQNITGANGAEIDHIELFAPPARADADSKNFVLCPGKAYDRSPCGTGTSAKVACLIADNKLKPGQIWRQESIIGSLFEASARIDDQGRIFPRIKGQAYVNAESTILINPNDPYRFGIPR
jgi:4-hydroxyproline epimerase